MGLGCPLLRGSSDRRLRRCAATLPPLLERTFPGLIFSSVFGAVTVAIQGLEEENISVGVRHLSRKYCRQSSCKTSPSCWTRLRSLEASILGMVLTAPVTADCNFHRCISSIGCYRHCRQNIERVGRQVQVVQAWGNNRELPSKTIWYRWLVRVVVNCKIMALRGCNRRDWWHPCYMMLRSLSWV